jgi:L-alanine-DL-glutamate epimerase-like enolase superfamily enzyme
LNDLRGKALGLSVADARIRHENPFRDEVVVKPFELKEGQVEIPTGPGLGIEVDEDVVRKFLLRK